MKGSSLVPQAHAGGFWVTGRALLKMPTLPALLAGSLHSGRDDPTSCQAVLAWGRKPSALVAQRQAQRLGLPLLRLEDGFLRSWGTGDRFAPLALVTDSLGIYYDCTQPSDLESLLNAQGEIAVHPDVAALKAQVLRHGLSKYNHAPDGAVSGAASAGQGVRVLVIDQTWGDVSVALGAASADTFSAMLAAARAENPGATIYVKTHPEVSSGRKRGYLTDVQDDAHTVVLRQAINPLSLIEQMDKVYVVTSTMGFEALLAGKPVTCFGMPWYAGWGVTDDRQTCARRTRQRTVDELFAAAYIHYTRYLNPVTHQRGTIMDVIDWLIRQRQMAAAQRGPGAQARRIVVVGLRRWKQANLSPMLALDRSQIHCVPDAAQAQALGLQPGDWLLFWGATPPAGLRELAAQTQAALVRMEDGFVRSVGLGSDLIRPQSLVLDQRGIYFDPSQPSDLEHLLAHTAFSADELAMAQRVRAMIVQHGITKYNVEPREPARWPCAGRRVLLVPGQVEDDASIRLGCTEVKTNLDLLRAARQAQPQAYIVYKPHPDVSSGNRVGRLALAQALQWADHVETRLSVVSCIDACDEVHTMTSLTGFDALLRGKTVVTYGQPFYAGWGLTEDRALGGVALARRTRRLTLDELVAGALLRYPIYWDWTLKGYTTCEAVLHRIIETRTALEQSGGLEQLRVGRVRRLGRKLNVLFRAWLGRES